MKKNTEYLKFLCLGLGCLLVTYFFPLIFISKASSDLSDLTAWYTYSFSKKSLKSLKLIGIAIDNHTLNNIHQRWPFRRTTYARLLQLLDKEKVKTIGFDLLFEGESEDKEDDRVFADALRSISSRVILAYRFDPKERASIITQFGNLSFGVGMINTPQDILGKISRLRSFIGYEGRPYYSFSIALSSAYLNQSLEEIISSIPLLSDKTYLINYLITPTDIPALSLYDVLENLPQLKQKYGNTFLKDSLVLIYPESEIIHDIYTTPLGKMPGGFLHLNGVVDIILQRFITESKVLHILFLAFSLGVIAYSLSGWGFISGLIIATGVLLMNFWSSVLFNLNGIKLDYSRIFIFALVFFVIGSLYKYVYSLAQLLKIKDKATLDPLRNIFTLRYFYYRLKLEQQKHFYKNRFRRKDLFLFFLYLGSFKELTEGLSLEQVKNTWQRISSHISLGGSLWSVYSEEEIVGYLISEPASIAQAARSLKNNLEAILHEIGIKSTVKLSYLTIRTEYPARELLFILSKEARNRSEEVIYLKDADLVNLSAFPDTQETEEGHFLKSLEEDIEEKNRQLLSLVENLNKEHLKTKEAFFQIITSLVNALEARDPYTQGHSERVCNYALKMADKLGWMSEEKEKLKKAALLHDIGKIGIHDNILHKKGQLTSEEFDVIKKHEIIGVKILEPLKEFSEILPWILYHHEKWDGKGYPHGLAGDAIPIGAQIISLSDVFDALSTGRDYKKAFSFTEATEEIIRNKGTQFNPRLVDIFVELILNDQSQK